VHQRHLHTMNTYKYTQIDKEI